MGIQFLDFDGFSRKEKEVKTAETMLENIDTILLNGAKLIIDKVYDSIGFTPGPANLFSLHCSMKNGTRKAMAMWFGLLTSSLFC